MDASDLTLTNLLKGLPKLDEIIVKQENGTFEPKNSILDSYPNLTSSVDIKEEAKSDVEDGLCEIKTLPVVLEQIKPELDQQETEHNSKSEANKVENNELFKCKICLKGFQTATELFAHNNREGEIKGVFICCACNKSLKNHSRFIRHIKTHRDRTNYTCKICGVKFTRCKYLEEHMQTHPPVKIFACNQCDKTFNLKSQLHKHERHHNDETNNLIFPCRICSKRFWTDKQMMMHMRKHNGKDSQFHCLDCGKTFKEYSCYENHLRVHKGRSSLHKCKLCLKIFNCAIKLEKHVGAHATSRSHVCKVCGHRFAGIITLTKHMKIHNKEKTQVPNLTRHIQLHTSEQDVSDMPKQQPKLDQIIAQQEKCMVVNFFSSTSSTNNKEEAISNTEDGLNKTEISSEASEYIKPVLDPQLKEHKLKITGVNESNNGNFECKICSKSFLTASDLDIHNNRQVKKNLFACCSCFMFFENMDQLDIHNKGHTGETFNCRVCRMVFIKYEDFENHMSIHVTKRMFICSKCDGNFGTAQPPIQPEEPQDAPRQVVRSQSRLRQMCSKTPYSCEQTISCKQPTTQDQKQTGLDFQFWCEFCDKEFDDYSKYKSHLAVHNKSPKGCHKCEICGNVLNVPILITQKVDSTNVTSKPHVCEVCLRGFSYAETLRNHMKTHTTKRMYECAICDMSFVTVQILNRHIQVHSGEKRFACPTCGKRFTQKRYVIDHMSRHAATTDECCCSICNKRFTLNKMLYRHIRAKHPELVSVVKVN